MPETERSKIENFEIRDKADGTTELIETCFVKNCEGATPKKRLNSARTAPGMPQIGDRCEIDGLYLNSRSFRAWGDTDAIATLEWSSRPPKQFNAGGIPQRIEIGATLRQVETDFDADNRKKAFELRTPIQIQYTATGSTSAVAQNVTCPVLVPSPSFIFETVETTDPGEEAVLFVGATNSKKWIGVDVDVALCMSVQGVSEDGGKTFRVRREYAMDPFDKWKQTARYRDPLTGQLVVISAADLKASNGIKLVRVQHQMDFNLQPIKYKAARKGPARK